MIANPFNSIIITFPGFKSVHPLIIWMKKAPRSYCFIILKQVLSSGQVGCRRSSILQVSMSEIDLPSTPSDEVISQTQSFSIFDVSQLFIFATSNSKTHYSLFIRLEWKQSWIGPKILQQEQIISCLISSQVVWHFVPCSNIPELHFDWLMTFEFLQNFFMRFQKFSIN